MFDSLCSFCLNGVPLIASLLCAFSSALCALLSHTVPLTVSRDADLTIFGEKRKSQNKWCCKSFSQEELVPNRYCQMNKHDSKFRTLIRGLRTIATRAHRILILLLELIIQEDHFVLLWLRGAIPLTLTTILKHVLCVGRTVVLIARHKQCALGVDHHC